MTKKEAKVTNRTGRATSTLGLAAVLVSTLVGSTLLAAPAFAAKIDLSKLTHGGNGCPGTGDGVQARLRSGGRLIVRMPEAKLDLSARALDRKTCSIALPVVVAPNERLVLRDLAIFGTESLRGDDSLNLRAELFAPDAQGPSIEANATGRTSPRSIYARLPDELALDCGKSTTVRVNAAGLARRQGASSVSRASLDGVALTLKIESCSTELLETGN